LETCGVHHHALHILLWSFLLFWFIHWQFQCQLQTIIIFATTISRTEWITSLLGLSCCVSFCLMVIIWSSSLLLIHQFLHFFFFILQHKTQSFSFDIFITFYHNLFKFFEVFHKKNLFDNLPVILVIFSGMTSSKELLLVDTNFSKESLHEFIDQFSKSFVDGFVIFSVAVLTNEIYTVFLNERLDRCLPSCTLKEFVNCVENPVLKDR